MPSNNVPFVEGNSPEESARIEILLTRIEEEKVPERLLTLARELQTALNNRKRQIFGDGDL
jgi:hypothetical protein